MISCAHYFIAATFRSKDGLRNQTQPQYGSFRYKTETRMSSTFSSWFHAWSRVHGVTKQTVSWHCVSNNSCIRITCYHNCTMISVSLLLRHQCYYFLTARQPLIGVGVDRDDGIVIRRTCGSRKTLVNSNGEKYNITRCVSACRIQTHMAPSSSWTMFASMSFWYILQRFKSQECRCKRPFSVIEAISH